MLFTYSRLTSVSQRSSFSILQSVSSTPSGPRCLLHTPSYSLAGFPFCKDSLRGFTQLSSSPSYARPSTFTSQATPSEPSGASIVLTQCLGAGRSSILGGRWCCSPLRSGLLSSSMLTCHKASPNLLKTHVVGVPSRKTSSLGLLSFSQGFQRRLGQVGLPPCQSFLRFQSSLPWAGPWPSFGGETKSGRNLDLARQIFARSGKFIAPHFRKRSVLMLVRRRTIVTN